MRVSKANAASPKEQVEVPRKRKATKRSYAEEEDADEEKPSVSPRSGTKNGEAAQMEANAGSDLDEAETFEVELILASRVRHGKQQFKIRWKGYGPADDTWEDEENIDSPELVAAFLKGSDDEKPLKEETTKTPKKRGSKPPSKEKVPAKKSKSENGTGEFEVSKIVDDVELKDGTRQFLVRWKGFTSKENTWEPEANLNCPDLIQKYLALQQQVEDTTRETRTDRRQVHKYNPELTKRRSHRSATVKRMSYHDLE